MEDFKEPDEIPFSWLKDEFFSSLLDLPQRVKRWLTDLPKNAPQMRYNGVFNYLTL